MSFSMALNGLAAPMPKPAGNRATCCCATRRESSRHAAVPEVPPYGEYVFDWSRADAWQRSGLHYYPAGNRDPSPGHRATPVHGPVPT